MAELLLEIGTEELPAGYIEPALKTLAANLIKTLKNARIDFGEAKTMGTPRRLAVAVTDVSTRQRPLVSEIVGPPKTVGYDDAGRPTVAARKFAERVGVPVNSLGVKETPKGPYLCVEKAEKGIATKSFLRKVLPDVVLSISFPKTMRWADLTIQFARPVRSVMALLDAEVISFQVGDIKSRRYTFGHRFMHAGRIKIAEPSEYIAKLRKARVLVDIAERKKTIASRIADAAGRIGGQVLPDEELVETVKNLVEYPDIVAGRFDSEFLRLPREILITAMREHQKYFAVVDPYGELMPFFIAVNNTVAREPELVAKGNERVLRARLSDARFFFDADLKIPLDRWLEQLHGVLFQAKLGTMYDKVMRIEKLSVYLADLMNVDEEFKKLAATAARLCKIDLVSQVVGEFPKLQGVMGRIYAAESGRPEPVSTAIEEHYRPTYSGGPLPESTTGAIVGMADKMDSICGCFRAGLLPTGASDPYALRRQGIGIVQIILDRGLSLPLTTVIEASLGFFEENQGPQKQEIAGKVYAFLENRIVQMMADEGYPKDIIAAATSVSVDDVPAVWSRVRALTSLRSEPDFEPLAIAFKRVVNIIKQAGPSTIDDIDGTLDERLFQDDCESQLLRAFQEVEENVKRDLERGAFDQALHDIASLRPSVDAFFDGVMVMAEDERLRKNRLALLGKVALLFENFADFSRIST